MVAHSTGGLVARLYMHKLMPNVPDARPQVKHLVMLGTPNGGIPCADLFVGKLNLFKETVQPLKEFTNDEMLRFNQFVVNTGGTKLSALVGNSVPIICGGYEWNDGFVTVRSAKYGVDDFAYSNDLNGQLVDGKNFGNFVKPHLVTGPKKTYPLPVKSDPNDIDRWKINGRLFEYLDPPAAGYFRNASLGGGSLINENTVEVTLEGHEQKEIEIPVDAASNLGVSFMAAPSVSASLIDDHGTVVKENLAGSDLAASMFRTLYVNKPIAAGRWMIKFTNTSDREQIVVGFSWSAGESAKVPVA
jgi:hypothetical protein